MSKIESNVFLVENIKELSCNYWLYKVRGLSTDLDDYQKNIQLLTSKLTRDSGSTCAHITIGKTVYIAQPEGGNQLPTSVDLIRAPVKLEREPDLKRLQFDELDDTTAVLAERFLNGALQSKFWNMCSRLWQPSAGHPFFEKNPDIDFRDFSNELDLYRGFTFRVIIMPEKRIGVCIDIRSKYVSKHPLPTKITTEDIAKYKGLHCLYEYGNQWYEIVIQGRNDFNVSELELPNGKTLFEQVKTNGNVNSSQLIRTLPNDCSVIFYYDSEGEPKNVPSGLCRRTFKTNHPLVKKYHRNTIKAPHLRRRDIDYVVNKYFNDLSFNGQRIILSRPISYKEETFNLPDIRFGNGKVLSTTNTPGALTVDLASFGSVKKQLIYSQDAGLYVKEMFDKQFLVMPKSVLDTFGDHIINDLKSEVNRLFVGCSDIKYNPIIVPYNDSVQKSIARVGNEILKAIDDYKIDYGYGIVMIPSMPSKRMTKEDELANLVMREMRKRDLYVSVIHTKTAFESFSFQEGNGKEAGWKLISDFRIAGKYKGYIQNVVLNKLLLLNEYWPFVLATPLKADIVIGIDVKNSTAGFTTVHKNGENLTFMYSESEQKERLGKDQLRKIIQKIIYEERKKTKSQFRNIAIQRQGTLFDIEKKGIEEALKSLAIQGTIDQAYVCTFVEVRTTSRMPFRMFKVTERMGRQQDWIENPVIGTYKTISPNEAFLCNTGMPFARQGTTHPLHILKEGPMPIEEVLQDIFYLACLTWTKIDDCLRLPITIKMGDIRLREIAGEYDPYAMRFEEDENEEA